MERKKRIKRPGAYDIMWVIVMFDLPTETSSERKKATGFRNSLLELGFHRKQLSVYMRHSANLEKAKSMGQKVKNCLFSEGLVSILYITDRQYAMVENFIGKRASVNEAKKKQEEKQLQLF